MNPARRNGLAAVGVLALVLALFVILRPGGAEDQESSVASSPESVELPSSAKKEAPRPAPVSEPIPEILIRDGQPVGGPLKIEAEEGDTVRFAVDSDVDEEIHVHGFDVSQDVEAGQRVKVSFGAEFTGIFEVELERSAVPIAEVQVNP
jgi:hypothetical protein